MIYAQLLDKMRLSRKNGWRDEDRALFANYSLPSLARDTGLSVSTVQRAIRELEERGLLLRQRNGNGPVRHYPRVPAGWMADGREQPAPRRRNGTSCAHPADPGDLDWLLEQMKESGQNEHLKCSD